MLRRRHEAGEVPGMHGPGCVAGPVARVPLAPRPRGDAAIVRLARLRRLSAPVLQIRGGLVQRPPLLLRCLRRQLDGLQSSAACCSDQVSLVAERASCLDTGEVRYVA